MGAPVLGSRSVISGLVISRSVVGWGIDEIFSQLFAEFFTWWMTKFFCFVDHASDHATNFTAFVEQVICFLKR